MKAVEKRKRKCAGYDCGTRSSAAREGSGCGCCFYSNSLAVLLGSVGALVLLSQPTSAAAWLSRKQFTSPTTTAWNRNHRSPFGSRCSREPEQRLYSTSRPQKIADRSNNTNENEHGKPNSKLKKKEFQFDYENSSDDLDSLRAQAAKLRQEAESLQSAVTESKEAKMKREINKVDGWIEDLLIQVTLGDGTELLKTVDQVYGALMEERYSGLHVLKIFERLCDLREQESRSNCSPLMELLVDATGKLDCTEREDNPNKRWNYKVERVLRRKLFARDWNIHYVSEDENEW